MSTTDMDQPCASYSPSLVKMITSFVKSGKEDAEVRAHKSLSILQAKDLQLQQLQERISYLEDYVNTKEGFVPKLQLPVSASVCKSENDIVTRDVGDFPATTCNESQQLLLLLPQDFLESSPENFVQDRDTQSIYEKKEQVVSGSHNRWQTMVEQMEHYNKQLEADLKHENKLRLKDKQKYCDALAGVTEALCHVKSAMEEVKQYRGNCKPDGDNNSVFQGMEEETNKQNLKQTVNQILNNKSKSLLNVQLSPEDKLIHNHNQSSLNLNYQSFNKEQIIGRLLEAQQTIVDLQKNILETDKRYKREWCMRKSLEKILGKYHRPNRSSISDSTVLSSFRARKKKYLPVAKRKTEYKIKLNKLQQKCTHLQSELEKKNESYKKLKMEIVSLSETCTSLRDGEEKFKIETLKKDEIVKKLKEKLVQSPTSELLQGRLDAVAQVMAKQHKQLKQAEQECQESRTTLENIKKRLSRAEALSTKRETLAETWRKQQSDMEMKLVTEQEKNKSLTFEVSKLKDVISSMNSQITNLKQKYENLIKKKNESENNLTEMKTMLEHKLNILSEALQKKISSSEESETVLQNKLGQLRTQFVSRIKEASYKIASADTKIQELFGGIELFLKMLLASQPPPSISTLNSPQAEEAVYEACNILNLSPAEMKNIVNSASTSNHNKMNWLQECYELIHLEVFSEKLGHLLFDAVNHIKK